jgi:hypothetical protein
VIFCAASTLVSGVLAGPLVEVARTRVGVHYETGDPAVPVLCVATADAVLLPNSVLVGRLPTGSPELVVRRWWRPERPTGLVPPSPAVLDGLAATSYDVLSPAALVGRGPGLTPSGDDVLAGALVAAHATGDPRLPGWCRQTTAALARRSTTAVSRALLTHAMDGYAVPELARFLTTVCSAGDVAAALVRLRAVGHTSGQALVDGVVHTLSTRSAASAPIPHRGAA